MAEVLTTSEAVRRFRMHPATVLRLILTQRVTANKDANGRWLIRRSDLERWNEQRRRRKSLPAAPADRDVDVHDVRDHFHGQRKTGLPVFDGERPR